MLVERARPRRAPRRARPPARGPRPSDSPRALSSARGRHPAQSVGQPADELGHELGAGVERLALVGMGRPVGGGHCLRASASASPIAGAPAAAELRRAAGSVRRRRGCTGAAARPPTSLCAVAGAAPAQDSAMAGLPSSTPAIEAPALTAPTATVPARPVSSTELVTRRPSSVHSNATPVSASRPSAMRSSEGS